MACTINRSTSDHGRNAQNQIRNRKEKVMADFEFETAAKKILGNSGKMPKPRVDPRTAIAVANKAVEAFKKQRGDLEKALLDMENGYSQYKNTLKQYSDIVDGDDFGLDDSKPDDKKKIDAAKAAMEKGIGERIKALDGYLEMLGKLDQILTNLHRLDNLKI